MEFWAEIVGQREAVATLERAAEPDGRPAHAWLITGPPGSGRSNLARRFAAALAARTSDDREAVMQRVEAGTHPDVRVLATQKLIITIADVRDFVTTAYYAPSEGRYRVNVIEDADRMGEHASNVLLKSIEEPPERTIWVLCAPSESDLLPTIRSRSRSLRLVTPSVSDVAELLVARDGIDAAEAERAARLAQSHIGMARRLATDSDARERRARTIDAALGVATLGEAMAAAAALFAVAEADGKARSDELDAREREEVLRGLGVEPGKAVPSALRSQLKTLEEEQKRRAKRGVRDGIDRILTDLLSLYRDVLLTAIGAEVPLINAEAGARIRDLAEGWGPERAERAVDAVEAARERLFNSITPALVLEALFARLIAISDEAPQRPRVAG